MTIDREKVYVPNEERHQVPNVEKSVEERGKVRETATEKQYESSGGSMEDVDHTATGQIPIEDEKTMQGQDGFVESIETIGEFKGEVAAKDKAQSQVETQDTFTCEFHKEETSSGEKREEVAKNEEQRTVEDRKELAREVQKEQSGTPHASTVPAGDHKQACEEPHSPTSSGSIQRPTTNFRREDSQDM